MPIDKSKLIPFLKGIAEGYEDPGYIEYSGYQIAAILESAIERIESGEFDEDCTWCDNTGYTDCGHDFDVEPCTYCDNYNKVHEDEQ